MSKKSTYTVMITAPFVAGRRSPGKGSTIELCCEEAKYPLILAEVARPNEIAKQPAAQTETKKAAREEK